jgi:putative inorganic carbon (HCO3(-)) transporter
MKPLRSIRGIFENKYFLSYSTLIFFLPLVFMPDFNEIFEFPKMALVYLAAIFVAVLFILDMLLKGVEIKFPDKRVLLYLVSFIISTLFSVHVYTSLVGYYTRYHGGLLSVLAYFVLFFVAVNTLRKDHLAKLTEIMVLSTLVVSIYAIFQKFGLLSSIWDPSVSQRVFSTFGQPNWLAQFLAMLLPLSLFFLFTRKSYIWLVVYLFGFPALWFTYSVSGILGFAGGILLFLYVARSGGLLSKSNRYILSVVFLYSLVTTLLFPGIFFSKVGDIFVDIGKRSYLVTAVHAQGVVDIVNSGQNVVSDPGFIRSAMWKGTLDLIFSSSKVFLIGTGPETFPYSFQKFRPLSVNHSSEWNYVLNKPHNHYLEIWSEEGLIGLLANLVLAVYLFKNSKSYVKPILVAFYITNIFGWPVVTTNLIWWMLLASIEIEGGSGE